LRGKQIKVEVLLAAIAVLVVTGATGMLVRPAQPPDQVLKARLGDVIWNHDLHARMPEIGNCMVCHHTERQGITSPVPCTECHTPWTNRQAMVIPDLYMEVEQPTFGGKDGPPAMQIFHGKCLGCHNAMSEGPVACRDCHAQSFSGSFGMVEWDHRKHARKMEMACVDCHHKDTKARWDGEYRSCSACHAPAKVLELAMATGLEKHEDAKHGRCHTCHTQYNPENDPRSCTDCHPGLILPDEHRAPSLEEAVHGRCMECHSVDSDALETTMPVICIDCHKPDPSMITHPAVGPVLFSHKRHAEYAEWTCIDCHHTDVPGEPHIACYRCHAADHFEGIPPLLLKPRQWFRPWEEQQSGPG